jgi:hypothetical protein
MEEKPVPNPGFARPDLSSIRTPNEQDEFAEAVRGGFSAGCCPLADDDPPAPVTMRTYATFFAGLNAMRRSRFPAVNAAADMMWAAACSFGAYALGSTATRVVTVLTIGGLAAVGLVTIVLALVMGRAVHRLEARAAAAFPDLSPPTASPVAGSTRHGTLTRESQHEPSSRAWKAPPLAPAAAASPVSAGRQGPESGGLGS